MKTYYLVWGNPRIPGEYVAFRNRIADDAVQLKLEGRYAALEVGPVPVSGPVISRPGEEDLVILLDASIPEWVQSQVLAGWGWEPVVEIPRPGRFPFPVDLLVLSQSWTGAFDGWSRTLWLDAAVRPMQRIDIPVGPDSKVLLSVRVLEVGVDQHGVGYAVVYAPERNEVDNALLGSHGWRAEPWVRIRRKTWMDLADLSGCVEAQVVTAMRSPIISQMMIHDLRGINGEALAFLPEDVREALEVALAKDLPDSPTE